MQELVAKVILQVFILCLLGGVWYLAVWYAYKDKLIDRWLMIFWSVILPIVGVLFSYTVWATPMYIKGGV